MTSNPSQTGTLWCPQSHIVHGLPCALTITICGGGNGAHTTAAYLSSKPGLSVNVLTRQPEKWSKELLLLTEGTSWENKKDIHGVLDKVSKDPQDVIPLANLIIIASPAHTHPEILKKIAPFVKAGTMLGSIYCQGGFDWCVSQTFPNISLFYAIFGFQHIPWICKTIDYGTSAKLIGVKKHLKIATYPLDKAVDMANLSSVLFDIPCQTVPNFLSLTLTPSNQIIHPARYYGMFQFWDGQTGIPKDKIQWGLYVDMDDISADYLSHLDSELQQIKQAIIQRYPDVDLTAVLPIGERIIQQYDTDVQCKDNLKMIFRTNRGYAGCITPVELMEDGSGYRPALKSRLFWEDIPFGLCILKSIAQMANISTPYIDRIVCWHQTFMNKEYIYSDGTLNSSLFHETGVPEAYGIYTLEQLVQHSRQ